MAQAAVELDKKVNIQIKVNPTQVSEQMNHPFLKQKATYGHRFSSDKVS